MNIKRSFITLLCAVCFFQRAYCPYTDEYIINQLTDLKKQLTELKGLLQPALPELSLQKKIGDFFNALVIDQIPSGLVYELYTQANILPSKPQEELNVTGLTDLEKRSHKRLFQEFSDLIQEIDQSLDQSTLLTFLRDQLENLLKQIKVSGVNQNHKKLYGKIKDLIDALDEAHYPTEILRKILESLRVLPILPPREEPLELSEFEKQQERNLMAQHAAIMRAIQKKKDKDKIRKEYIDKLKKAYSEMNMPTEEQERPLPPLPESEETKEKLPPQLPEETTELPAPEQEEEKQGVIPPPPPLPEKKKELSEQEKTEVRKELEERLKEGAENLKKIEQQEPQERGKKQTEWDDILKKALEERRSSIEQEEEEEPEEEAEWEYNPWE